jgi:hypothetical protein
MTTQSIPASRRERYVNQDISVRLGGLAADLARVASFIRVPALPATETMLEESRAFIEWTAPDLLPDRVDDAARLVDIQRGLTHWHWIWDQARNDPAARAKLADQAQAWSDEVLAMSGLLNEE